MFDIKDLYDDFLCKRDIKKFLKIISDTKDLDKILEIEKLIEYRKRLYHWDFHFMTNNKYRF